MLKFIKLAVSSFILVVFGLTNSQAGSEQQNHQPVSIIQLIAKPEAFIDKKVVVDGYLERSRLYYLFFSESDFDYANFSNGIIIKEKQDKLILDLSSCKGSMVMLFGTFGVSVSGQFAITSVDYIKYKTEEGFEDCNFAALSVEEYLKKKRDKGN